MTVQISCPWCGATQEHGFREASVIDIVCNGGVTSKSGIKWCNKPMRVKFDRNGNVKQIERIAPTIQAPRVALSSLTTSSPRAKTTTAEIYEEALRVIRTSKNVDEQRKAQAEDILEYVKTYTPYFLPVVADGVKKVFYL